MPKPNKRSSDLAATENDAEIMDSPDLGDLESLDGDEYADVTWYVYRLKDGQEGTSLGRYVAKIAGPLDLDALRAIVGGGRFRLFGRGPRGSALSAVRRTIEIEGPPRTPPMPVDSDPTPTPAPASSTDRQLAELAEQVKILTQKLASTPATPTTPPATGLGLSNIGELVQLVRTLAPPPPTEPVIAALTKGIEIGRESSGDGDGDGLAGMVKAFAPALVQLLKVASTPAPAPAPPPGPARVGSQMPVQTVQDPRTTQNTPPALAGPVDGSGEIVSDPGQDTTTDMSGFVMLSQIITRGMKRSTPPESVADALVDLMDEDQLNTLTTVGASGLIQVARSNGLDKQVPDLNDPGLPAYLELVLKSIEDSDA